jgi:hypothetical protein
MRPNRIRAGSDDELEAGLRNAPHCEVPAGLLENLLAAIRVPGVETETETIFPNGPSVPSPKRLRSPFPERRALLFAAAACVPAAIGLTTVLLLHYAGTAPTERAGSGRSSSTVALNTHAEETRPCDVLPPLP